MKISTRGKNGGYSGSSILGGDTVIEENVVDIMDADIVSISNLQRQIVHNMENGLKGR